MAKKIFIAATMQNDGKTTVSLGLISVLKKYFARIGFIKPIGQRYLVEQGYKVDEDSVLIEKIFGIRCNLKDMSPVAIERGFTERYIENGPEEDYAKRIKDSYERVAKDNDLVIIEGTGHAGVGSVFDLSNATVAKLLDANAILVSSGGIGRPIDEVMLNKPLFDKEGVRLAGVIVNKVLPEKYDKVARLVKMGFAKKDLNVLGVLPYHKMLDTPTIREIREELKLQTLFEGDGMDMLAERILIGAMNVKDALKFIQNNSLMIIPGDRDDMIRASCAVHSGKLSAGGGSAMNGVKSGLGGKKGCKISGMILSGGLIPKRSTLEFAKKSRISTLTTKEDTYSIASCVHHILVKLKPQDTLKTEAIVNMIQEYVDIGEVLANIK